MSLKTFRKLLPSIMAQACSRQTLNRTPEKHSQVIDAVENVAEYDDHILSTRMGIVYAVYLEFIFRALTCTSSKRALDLACGPGQFTLLLQRHLKIDSVVGLDLSAPMIEAARSNAHLSGLSCFKFLVGNVMDLQGINDHEFDLSTLVNTAHHMPELENVTQILNEMERVTKPEGLVFLGDVARLKSKTITDRFIDVIGSDMRERSSWHLLNDFTDSMFAAFTGPELKSAIPIDTKRRWYHLSPRVLPSVQYVFGIPATQQKLFLRGGLPWSRQSPPFDSYLEPEWKLLKRTLIFSHLEQI